MARFSMFNEKNSYIMVTNNGRMIVCWHPESVPPYDHTKPLPKLEPEINEGDSVLKVQYRKDEKYRFQPDGPTIPQLTEMTFTSKHRWYPKKEDKYKDPNPPVDREGL